MGVFLPSPVMVGLWQRVSHVKFAQDRAVQIIALPAVFGCMAMNGPWPLRRCPFAVRIHLVTTISIELQVRMVLISISGKSLGMVYTKRGPIDL